MSKPRNNPIENYHGLRNTKIIPWSEKYKNNSMVRKIQTKIAWSEEYKNNSMVGKIQTIISWSKKYKQ